MPGKTRLPLWPWLFSPKAEIRLWGFAGFTNDLVHPYSRRDCAPICSVCGAKRHPPHLSFRMNRLLRIVLVR
jgi:hypothetical protein